VKALARMCALAAAIALLGAAAAPAPSPGDLRHLTYTATGTLSASFVTPATGAAEPNPVAQVTASTERGGGVELSVDGGVVPAALLGERTVNIKTGETRYLFYGVPLKAGPNVLTLVPLGANGARGRPVSITVYGPGPAESVRADVPGHLVADGKTPGMLRIWVTDRYGHPAAPGARVAVRVLSGSVRLAKSAQTMEIPLPPGGYVEVPLYPGVMPGAFEVEIGADRATARERWYVNPYLRAPFVNGVISLGGGVMPNPVDGDGIYDGGSARQARAALFASGRVGRSSLLTLAYESQNPLTQLSSVGSFAENPDERPYQTYGDASVASSPLQSENRLYARLDNGQSSLMWGLFTADIGAGAAGMYRQLLNGAKLDLTLGRSGGANLVAFSARNDTAFVSQTLPVLGLAALEQPLYPDIVVGSDFLQLVTLDRHTGLVISEVPLIRNVDYTIDYATGTLRFINIPLPYDANFNPQAVLLQYEYEGPGIRSQTTGGGLTYDLSRDRGSVLQLGYVNDATGTQNYALFSQQITRSWSTGSIAFSHAASAGSVPDPSNPLPLLSGGGAFEFSLKNHDAQNQYAVDLTDTSAGFSNPFGGLNTPGMFAYHAAYVRTVTRRYSVNVAFDGQNNQGTIAGSSSESDATAVLQYHANDRLTLLAGLTRHAQSSGTLVIASPAPEVSIPALSQLQANAGVEYKATKQLGVSVQTYKTIAGSDVGSTQPSQMLAQVSYALKNGGQAYVREFWSAQPTTTFAEATNGITYGAGATHALQLGVERPVSPATALSTDYLIERTGSATNVYTALGVQEKLSLGKRLSGNLNLETANATGPGSAGFTVGGGSFNYAASKNVRATLSYQTRAGDEPGSTFALGVAGQVSPNLSLLGTAQHAYSGLSSAIDDQMTLAYRPAADDRFISLLAYQRSSGLTGGSSVGNLASFEELYRPVSGLELAGHYAFMLSGDGYYTTHTSLYAVRLRKNVGRYADLGAEVQTASAPSAASARSTDFAAEAGYTLGSSSRFAAGYDFSGSADPTLAGRPARRGLYFTATMLVDRIFGWGKP
jgi:hypothetical protein